MEEFATCNNCKYCVSYTCEENVICGLDNKKTELNNWCHNHKIINELEYLNHITDNGY